MGTRLKDGIGLILDSFHEGRVNAVISLYTSYKLQTPYSFGDKSRRKDLLWILTNVDCGISMKQEDAEYWLDWFNIKD